MAHDESLDEATERWAASFRYGDLSPRPARPICVLTCMDARLMPMRTLGLEIGDANVIRNAGGRVTADALRSMILSTQVLGTREIVVLHHTKCGLVASSDDAVRDRIEEASGSRPDEIDFLTFTDTEASVREDVEAVRACPYLPRDLRIWGAIYDVENGVTRTVIEIGGPA